ncbi:MAG: Cytochrome oxidase assembly [Piccolia ochrophora]|nr:MAG: Cytochrome oxidase assembly [Piccolia ochrophora]
MPTFPSRPYRPANLSTSNLPALTKIGIRYRALLHKHPFALFGLPFLVTIVAGSFFLTPATALRYEKHDRKVRLMGKEEALGLGVAGEEEEGEEREDEGDGVVDASGGKATTTKKKKKRGKGKRVQGVEAVAEEYYRLAGGKLDEWEQKRVERLEGEGDGVL